MRKLSQFLISASILLSACYQDEGNAAQILSDLNLGNQNAVIALTSGSNNDVNIAPNGNTTTYIRFTVNAANSTLSGMSSTTVSNGDLFIVRNESSTGKLLITNEDSASVAANRFLTAGGVTVEIPPRSSALVEYDGTTSRWWASLVAPANPTFTGNVTANGSEIPVLSSCGTSPAIVAGSTGFSGSYTTGSGATTCTLTFAKAFGVAPSCLIVAPGAAVVVPTYTTSTTAITVTVDIASTTYHYNCVGH